ncbi:MAG: clostripain-related cysteine peptidase [Chloroflexales bacterium]
MLRPRMLLALLVLPLALAACAGGVEKPTPRPAAVKPTALAKPTAAPKPTALAKPTAAPKPAADDTWLVMLYEDADDQVLEQDMVTDVNEAERVGSSANVTIVAQVDRYKGAFRGDGNWTGTRRLHITKDDDLKLLHSEVVADLGEVNMADGQTLVDFAEWAINTYPAAHHALILSDHGMGWPGGWSDGSQTKPGPDGLGLTSDGDLLLLDEIDSAMGKIRADTGIGSFDLIGFDACLMGQIEVLTAVAPHTRYVVASEEVEPALGWAYAGFLAKLVDNPAMDGGTLSKAIVQSYIDQDQRIVDDKARAEFVKENFDTTKVRSARAVAADMSHDVTLSAYDTAALPDLLAALDDFGLALSKLNKKTVASARTYAQHFENTFDDGPSPYIDIGSFAAIIRKKSNTKGIDKAADALLAALKRAVIAEKHGDQRSGATGLSIYFPTSKLYKSTDAGREVYARVANRFATQAAWENYLNFYYYGVALDAPAPTGNTLAILSPGASTLNVAKLKLSAKRVAQTGTVTVSTSVDGDQVGFIYFFTGVYRPDDDSILVADIDYLDAGQTRDVNGVFYPDWGTDRPVAIDYDWTPVRFGISDGTTTQFALFAPSDYGAANDSATYVVHGSYRFVDGGSRQAQLFFKDNALIKILGFSSQGQASAPRAITPQPGDTFTVENQRIRLHSDSGGVKEYVTEAGATITFSDQPITMAELPAPAGSYVLGVQAEDMDGNLYDAYTNVTVNK